MYGVQLALVRAQGHTIPLARGGLTGVLSGRLGGPDLVQ
jgi:hypothetical protein